MYRLIFLELGTDRISQIIPFVILVREIRISVEATTLLLIYHKDTQTYIGMLFYFPKWLKVSERVEL